MFEQSQKIKITFYFLIIFIRKLIKMKTRKMMPYYIE